VLTENDNADLDGKTDSYKIIFNALFQQDSKEVGKDQPQQW
jgi:hypothetical protein